VPRVALCVAVLALALGACSDDRDPANSRGQRASATEGATATTALDQTLDHGPEVVDGVLYPPGVAVDEADAIGRTRTGWVVSTTSSGEDGSVGVFADDGRPLTEGHGVLGVALADPTGDLAAWVESRNDGDVLHLVVVDTATGEQLLRRSMDGGSVAAVWGDEVLVAGDYADGMAGTTYALTVDGTQERLPVVEDDIVWGFDGTHVVFGDFDNRVTVADRDGRDSHDYEAGVAFLSPGTGKVALLGVNGLEVVDLTSGDRTPLPVEDPSFLTYWTPAGDLVVWSGDLFGEASAKPHKRYVCLGGTPECHPAPSTHTGHEVGVRPADSLTNLFGQLG
jgi:hypothetical protein